MFCLVDDYNLELMFLFKREIPLYRANFINSNLMAGMGYLIDVYNVAEISSQILIKKNTQYIHI